MRPSIGTLRDWVMGSSSSITVTRPMQTAPLASLCSLIVDCPHSTPTWTDSGVIVLRSNNIRGGRLNLSSVSYTTEEHYQDRIRRATPTEGDIVITREAPMGEVAMIPKGLRACLGQRMVLLRPNLARVNPSYLLFALQSEPVQTQIFWHEGTGSTVSNLRIPALEALNIPVVPLDQQRVIAHILGTLDDKIDLNRRQNETLEAMGRALFKSWFVDFDPVRTKIEGGPSQFPGAAANLFPDSFITTNQRLVPEGWGVRSFASTVEILGGGTPKTSVPDYWGGDIPWFSVVDAPSDSDVWVVDTEKKITSLGVENSSTQVLPVGTTIISARGTVGRVALVGVPMAMNQSCYGLRGLWDTTGSYTYFSVRELVSSLKQRAHGSVFDTITRATLDGVEVVVPPEEVIHSFERLTSDALGKIRSNLLESASLSKLRDLLLPRLLSGALDIAAAKLQPGKAEQ